MTYRKRLVPTMLLGTALVLTLGAMVVSADEPEATKGPAVEASAVVPGTDQVIHQGASAREEATAILKGLSMMAFIDSETGALRAPTPEEVQKLAAAGQRLQSLSAKSQLEVLEFSAMTGGTAAEVPAELHSHTLVEISEDGEAHLRCSDSAKVGHETLSNPSVEEVE